MTKEQFINVHPNIKINNTMFLNEDGFRDFTEEELINLCSISFDNASKLFMYIYMYDYEKYYKKMLITISKTLPLFFDISNINDINENSFDDKRFDYNVIFNEYEILFSKGLIKNIDIDYKDIKDINFINAFLQMKKDYIQTGKLNDKVISTLNDYLKSNILKENSNLENIDSKINEIIGYLISGDINLIDIIKYDYSSYKRILVEGKYKDKLNNFDNNSLEVLLDIKPKQVKNLINIVQNSFEDFKHYNYDRQMRFAINLIAVLDYQNSEKLINMLNKDENKFRKVFSSLYLIDLQKIHLNSGKIVYDEQFINFFFSPNGLLKSILNNDYEISQNVDVIYAGFSEYEKRFKTQHIYNKIDFYKDLLKNGILRPLDPDLAPLEGSIINECVDNKKFQSFTNDTSIIQNVSEEYRKMRHNYQKTIPYVSGTKDGYYYETLSCDDPNLFVMGSKTNCCFKIGGEADSFVRYCAENVNGRVLVIKDSKENVCAMIPFVRNGNVLLCNSIESISVKNIDYMRNIFDVAKTAFEKMINISSLNENKEESISLVLMGNYKNQIERIGGYEMMPMGLINYENLRPLNETPDMYVNMGGYDYANYIITKKDDASLYTTSSFEATVRYLDPRMETKEIEKEYITEEDITNINKIYYEKTLGILDLSHALKIIYNKDFFILINDDYSIISCIVGSDPRAINEYNEYLSLEKEYASYFDKDGHVKEQAYYR